MESFIRETYLIITDKLTSNSVLDALYQESIITTEEYDDIQSLNGHSDNRRKLTKVLRIKNNSCIDKFIEIVERETAGQEDLIQKLKDVRDKLIAKNIEPAIKNLKQVERIWFGNLTVPPNFTGRIKEIQKLHEIVQNSQNSVPANFDAIALLCSVFGLGGVGKTTLARQFAFQYQDFFHGNVIWVRSEHQKDLEEDFRELAKHSLNITETEGDINKLVREVYNWFKDKKSLFIFDNVEDALHIKAFLPNNLPPKTQRPYLLATSRKQDLFGSVGNAFVLDVLNEGEALELIGKSLPKTSLDERRQLAEIVGHLPLALQQAVAYIRHRSRSNSIKLYLEDYEDNAKAVLSDEKFKNLTDYEKSTFITFKITKEKILEVCNECAELAENLLNCIAYSVPDSRPYISFDHDQERWRRKVEFCLSRFADYSVTVPESTNSDYLYLPSMHRLLQHVIRLSNENESLFLRQFCIFKPRYISSRVFSFQANEFAIVPYKLVSGVAI